MVQVPARQTPLHCGVFSPVPELSQEMQDETLGAVSSSPYKDAQRYQSPEMWCYTSAAPERGVLHHTKSRNR